jgi:hypothetical protein
MATTRQDFRSLNASDVIAEIQRIDPQFLEFESGNVLQSIDVGIAKRLGSRLESLPEFSHRPIEELTEELSILLPKCLVYRDNKLELEVHAISLWLELREFFCK